MAEKKKKKRGGRRCVAGAPNSTTCGNNSHTPGISMHEFPKNEKTRALWVRFVQRHRSDFDEPVNQYAVLCSAHFEKSCFTTIQHKDTNHLKLKRVLQRGSVPTRDTIKPPGPEVLTERDKRQLKRGLQLNEQTVQPAKKRQKTASLSQQSVATPSSAERSPPEPLSDQDQTESPSVCHAETPGPRSTETIHDDSFPTFSSFAISPGSPSPEQVNPTVTTNFTATTQATAVCSSMWVTSTPVSGCTKCAEKSRTNRSLKKSNRRLRRKVNELKQDIKLLKTRVVESEDESEQEDVSGSEPDSRAQVDQNCNAAEPESDFEMPEDDENDVDFTYAAMEESTESESNGEEDPEEHANEIIVDPQMPEYEQPKFIVFYWKLLSLFTMFCFNCKEAGPSATMKSFGTMVTVTQHCLKCRKIFVWQSQPTVYGKLPLGNLLLSFAILMAGASVSKVLLIFRHMGLCVYAARTYFRHQRSFIFPVILHYWEQYRTNLVSKLKMMKDVVWTGDGRFDSMGHSAKYGAYTMLCNSIMKIVHFEIIQANETGGSQQTELEGCQRCFAFLKGLGLTIGVFISDRHRSIAKWIRESCVDTYHFFDIWHVARSITKKLLKASKEKGCEIIAHWIRGIRKHLYWCATSTKQGFGALIVAKWNSFMRHVANKHKDHPDPLYKECNHGDLEPRKWIKVGTAAYQKLHGLLTNKTLVNDIKKLSSDAQTSCLEGFHSTLNHWHPKMICFSWLGTYCRHILASLHFNENVQRATQVGKNGLEYIKVSYPKYKLGEEVVRDVKTPPSYDYVSEMRKLLFTLPRAVMKETFTRYSSKAPKSLTSVFEDRVTKADAIKAYEERRRKDKTALFPTGEEQSAMERTVQESQPSHSSTRKTRRCRKCKQPMRGHTREKCQQHMAE